MSILLKSPQHHTEVVDEVAPEARCEEHREVETEQDGVGVTEIRLE